MRVLIVGAGAVGQVYGWHLQQGGAQVSFFVKEKYAMNLRTGLTLYGLNRSKPWEPIPFYGYETLTEWDEVQAESWDQVWLCMSSTGLQGEWLDTMLASIGTATLVSLQPGLRDQTLLREKVGAERLVTGLIGFIAYRAPLTNEPVERVGVAFFFPPFMPSPFSGPNAEVRSLVTPLELSRLPVKKAKEVHKNMALASALLMPVIIGLQGANWGFERYREGSLMDLATRAGRQATVIVAAFHGCRAPLHRHFVRASLLSFVSRIAHFFVPFPLETYLRVHFTKVGDQSKALLEAYLEEGSSRDLPRDALEALYEAVYGDR
jgi:hypothetical protein